MKVALIPIFLFLSQSHASTLKIVDFNLLHAFDDYEKRLETTVEGLKSLAPDFVFLQEASQGYITGRRVSSPERLARATGYYFSYHRSDGVDLVFGEGLAFLSKYPITQLKAKKLSFSAPFIFEQRWVYKAVIDHPLGRMDFFNTHLANSDEREMERIEQTLDVLDFIADESKNKISVLAGDINSDSGTLLHTLLTGITLGSPAGFLDTQKFLDPNPPPTVDPGNPYQDSTEPRRIDFIFLISSGIQGIMPLRSFRIFDVAGSNGFFASDHYGVFTEFGASKQKGVDSNLLVLKQKVLKFRGFLSQMKKNLLAEEMEAARKRNPNLSEKFLIVLAKSAYDSALRVEYVRWVAKYLIKPSL